MVRVQTWGGNRYTMPVAIVHFINGYDHLSCTVSAVLPWEGQTATMTSSPHLKVENKAFGGALFHEG